MRPIGAGYYLALTVTAILSSGWLCAGTTHAALAELPRLFVDTTYSQPRGKEHRVRQGGDFQQALDAARAGDIILLEAGASFTGPFRLPAKPGSDWIVVRSSAPDGILPLPGQRATPAHAMHMPRLEALFGPVIVTAPGAHHYRFIGIEIRPGTGVGRSTLRAVWHWITGDGAVASVLGLSRQTLVLLGSKETSIDRLPHHIIFDRCYIHGDPKGGARRGIALNSRYTAIIDSYLSDFKTVGDEAQAIAGWNGLGPHKIVNNYLEGAGENVIFGGGTPSIRGLVASDIEVRRNHFYKPLSWRIGDSTYEGSPWTIKNLFELKNARRVWIDGNLFEHSWVHGQDGFAILFTVRTEDDSAPWAVVEDIKFTNNVIRRCAAGINIMGIDDGSPRRNGRARRIEIGNNLFDEIDGTRWGGGGRLFQLLDGTQGVTIEHNTALNADTIIAAERDPHVGFVFSNNIVLHNEYGIIGTGFGVGHPSITRYFPDATIRRNVIVGGQARLYPPDNFFPGSLDKVGFVDRAAGDYRLKDSSRYRRVATDGGDVGVDFEALRASLGPELADQALGTRQRSRR